MYSLPSCLRRVKCTHHRVNLIRSYSSSSSSSPNEAELSRSSQYGSSILLPKTTYPHWLSNIKRLQLEVELQNDPKFHDLYSWQMQQSERELFVLHDGPPYANGPPHMGHAINKILKDIINRHKLLCNHRVHYVPGWDCHGLPIELKVATTKDLTPLQVRQEARTVAKSAIEDQKAVFKRWGIMGDWENCYLTFDKQYVTTQLQTFWTLYEKGLLFRDLKPVYWSPASGSALAEAELEYNHNHKSTAVYARFKFTAIPPSLNSLILSDKNVYALIWTTTPWTLPANSMICYSEDMKYSLVKNPSTLDYYIIAAELREELEQQLSMPLEHITTFAGTTLQDARYETLLSKTEAPFVAASHVSADKGTGLVHTCPEHGFDDFNVGSKCGKTLVNMVDEEGRYTHEAGDELKGKCVLNEGNDTVLKLFSRNIISQKDYIHSYPYDWRMKKPVIIRPSKQWFINTDVLKSRALECLKSIEIIPQASAKNMEWMLHSRPYWCISRQRCWGAPIPAFYEKSSGKPVITKKLIDHWCALINSNGTDFWWSLSKNELIPENFLENGCASVEELQKGTDILDIWFDSGISWKCVLKDANYMADICVEGIDQARGWFQASLLTGVALQDQAPYKKLLLHGFAVDSQHRKMSKSLGNVIDPKDVLEGVSKHAKSTALGADGLRWWVAGHTGTNTSTPVKQLALQQVIEDLRKFRKIFAFLLGVSSDFDPRKELVSYSKLRFLDRYVLHKISQLNRQVLDCYDQLKFNDITHLLVSFFSNEVSSLYIHMNKDRLYCDKKLSLERKSAQTVCYHLLRHLSFALAPIVPHFVEDASQHSPFLKNNSIFKCTWPICPEEWTNSNVEKSMNTILLIKNLIDKELQANNAKSGDFDLLITGPKELSSALRIVQADDISFYSDLCYIFQTSSVTLSKCKETKKTDAFLVIQGQAFDNDGIEFTATLNAAERNFCDRCRRNVCEAENKICSRCLKVTSS